MSGDDGCLRDFARAPWVILVRRDENNMELLSVIPSAGLRCLDEKYLYSKRGFVAKCNR